MTRSQLVAALVPETGEQHHHKRRGRAEEKHHWRQEQHQESVVADSVKGSQSPIFRRSPYKKVGSEKMQGFEIQSPIESKFSKILWAIIPPYVMNVMHLNVRLGKIHPQLITCPAGPALE